MNSIGTLTKISLGALAGVAVLATQLPAGSAHAEDINIGVGELQECTISKSMDSATPKLTQFAINGNFPAGDQITYTGLEEPATDQGDYNLWRSNFGAGGSAQASDGDVDGRDFLVWQRAG
ncbi:MAG TPA: hypothetical protein VFY90_06385 [Tepidiformaceae bacterium]|nr:hypothetical protein [Tepidiformaceae bacterium]